jgi:5-dehydro-2-deoxygluconokinase
MGGTGLDVITIGRVSIDLYAREAGVGFEGEQTFEKSVGGSPTNVAVAVARLGHRAAVVTKVGDDPFGTYVRRKLEAFGVDTRYVGTHPSLRTPLAFAAMDPAEDPPVLFYREPEAPDMTIEMDELDVAAVVEVPIFWVSASTLSRPPVADTVGSLLASRARRAHTVLDLDYRPVFWAAEEDARAHIGAAVAQCTIAVGNRTECDIAVGSADPATAADRLLERGVSLAIVKQGGDGVLVAWPDGRAVVRPRPVEVVCGLGAGDAFGGALCHGLLAGWSPQEIVEYANAAGAIVASRLLCSDAMPGDAEVRLLLERSNAR